MSSAFNNTQKLFSFFDDKRFPALRGLCVRFPTDIFRCIVPQCRSGRNGSRIGERDFANRTKRVSFVVVVNAVFKVKAMYPGKECELCSY